MADDLPTAPGPAAEAGDPFHAWVCRSSDVPAAAPGILAGLAIGVKDVIVTSDLPTRFGSAVPSEAFAELLALGDAECVRRLRAGGGAIVGKTVSAELATYQPGPTLNPRAPGRTPGGSSSGSAAAVAAGDVPLALATQTAGSVIRPASFCGVLGYKPSFGRYSTRGVLATATSLDTLGLIAREASVLSAADRLLCESDPPEPEPLARLVLYRTRRWNEVDLESWVLVEACWRRWRPLFADVVEREPEPALEALAEVQRAIHCGEVAEQLGWLADRYPAQVSRAFHSMVAEGRAIAGPALAGARQSLARARERAESLVAPGELWVTPAARGPAPPLAEGTGDPMFCRAWTALGTPCATLPAAPSKSRLPIGVQLVASVGADRALLDAMERLTSASANSPEEPSSCTN